MKLSLKTTHILFLFLFDLFLISGLNRLEHVAVWTVEQYLKCRYIYFFPIPTFLNSINYIVECLGQETQTSEVNGSFRERRLLGRACHF